MISHKIEEGRASFAYEKVQEISQKDCAGEYKSYVKKFPSYIQTNGLGAAIAFAYSKKNKSAWKALYQHLQQWLKQQKFIDNQELVEAVISWNSPKYRAATIETLALLNWMRRFAEGMIEKNSNTSS